MYIHILIRQQNPIRHYSHECFTSFRRLNSATQFISLRRFTSIQRNVTGREDPQPLNRIELNWIDELNWIKSSIWDELIRRMENLSYVHTYIYIYIYIYMKIRYVCIYIYLFANRIQFDNTVMNASFHFDDAIRRLNSFQFDDSLLFNATRRDARILNRWIESNWIEPTNRIESNCRFEMNWFVELKIYV